MGRQSPATTTTTTTSKVKVGKKKNKKRICKYFASGNCKFGEKCRDIHEGGSTKNEVAEPPSTTNSQVNTPPQPPSSTPTTNMNVCFKSDLKELKDQALVTQKHLSEMNLMMAKLQMSYALANSALDCMQSKISDMENIIEDETPNEGRDVEEETHRVQQQVVSARDNINEIPPAVTPTSITSTKKSKAVPSPPAKPQSTKSTNKSKAAPVHQQSINPQPVKSSDVKPNKEKMKLEVEEGIKGASSTSNTKMPILPPPIKSTTVEVSKPDKPQETVTKTPIKSTTVVVSKPDKREHQPEGWPALGDIDSKVKDEKKITAPTTREGSSLVPPPPSRDDNTRSMLDDIIINASGPYIGSPYKYISYLRKELEFSTAEEFVEIIKECLDVLASIKSGNTSKEDLHFLHTLLGGVEKGKEDEFCRVLLSSVSIITEVEATTPPIVEAPIVETPRVVADEMDTVNVAEISNPPPVVTSRPVKRSVVVELGGGTITSRQAQSKEKKPQQDLPQEKTTVKPKVFKADRATQKEAKKKERQAKLAEASRKKGEKISTVTLEQTAQEIVREDKRKSQYTAVTGGTVSPPPTGQEASRGLLSPRHSAVTSTRQRPAPQAAKPIVTPENFSLYIKRDGLAKENQDISPIFKLLQNKTTRDEGRQLMQLEGDTKVCKQAIVEMHKRKEALAKSIDSERANIVKWKGEMNKTEVSMKVKWSLDNLLTMGAVQLNKVLREM